MSLCLKNEKSSRRNDLTSTNKRNHIFKYIKLAAPLATASRGKVTYFLVITLSFSSSYMHKLCQTQLAMTEKDAPPVKKNTHPDVFLLGNNKGKVYL